MTATQKISRSVFVALIVASLAVAAALTLNRGDRAIKVSTVPGAAPTRVADEAGYVSPLSHFLIGDGLSAAFEQDLEGRIAGCMAGRGWRYTKRVGVVVPSQPSVVGELRVFRQAHGYSLPAPVGSTNNDDPNEKYYRSLDRRQQARYLEDLNAGDSEAGGLAASPAGCRPAAEAALQANLPLTNPSASAAVAAAMDRVTRDPKFEEARAGWRACMAGKGYQYKNLDDPGNEMRQKTAGAQGGDLAAAQAAEIIVAVADFDCAVGTTIAVRQELEQVEIADLKARFPQYANR